MVDEAIAQPFGNLALQRFEFGVDEFNDLAGLDVDQMVVVRLWRGFIARATIAKIVAIKNSCLFEQANSAIDRGDGNARIACRGAFVQLFDIGVIGAFRKHLRDYAALFGDPQTPFCAKRFNVDCLMQRVRPNTVNVRPA